MAKMRRLKALRIKNKLTITQVANYCGVRAHVPFVWEQGSAMPRPYNYAKLQKLFSAEGEDLFEVVDVDDTLLTIKDRGAGKRVLPGVTGRTKITIPSNFPRIRDAYCEKKINSREAAKLLGVSQTTFLSWVKSKQ